MYQSEDRRACTLITVLTKVNEACWVRKTTNGERTHERRCGGMGKETEGGSGEGGEVQEEGEVPRRCCRSPNLGTTIRECDLQI